MSTFTPVFSVINIGRGFIQVIDQTVYAGGDNTANFSDRHLTIITPDGLNLPDAVGSLTNSRTTIPFPIGVGAGDVIMISTNYNWDVCLTINMVLVPIHAVAGSIYLARQDTPTLSFCGQAYVDLQKQFYSSNANIYAPGSPSASVSNNSIRYRDQLLRQSNQLRIEIDNAQIRAAYGDLPGSQDSLNNANFLWLSATSN